MTRVCLLTGSPGAGKTTIIKQALTRSKVRAGGFYTEEIRSSGVRQGFKIVTLDGQEAILAHVALSDPYKVSKYSVDIGKLNEVGVSAVHRAIKDSDLIVIDEIGKMELCSTHFKDAVLKAIDSDKKFLGTVMLSPHPFTAEIKHHPGVRVVQVSRANRDQVLREVTKWLGLTVDENNSQDSRQY